MQIKEAIEINLGVMSNWVIGNSQDLADVQNIEAFFKEHLDRILANQNLIRSRDIDASNETPQDLIDEDSFEARRMRKMVRKNMAMIIDEEDYGVMYTEDYVMEAINTFADFWGKNAPLIEAQLQTYYTGIERALDQFEGYLQQCGVDGPYDLHAMDWFTNFMRDHKADVVKALDADWKAKELISEAKFGDATIFLFNGHIVEMKDAIAQIPDEMCYGDTIDGLCRKILKTLVDEDYPEDKAFDDELKRQVKIVSALWAKHGNEIEAIIAKKLDASPEEDTSLGC